MKVGPQVCDLDGGLAVVRLAEELVEEILLRIPPDEPAHLVRASLVCKAWHSILSDDIFRRRYYRRFHRTPPLQGYFCSYLSDDSTIRFVPTTSIAAASPVCALRLDRYSCGQKPSALDCRHGRVLIAADYYGRLIVLDPVTGSQQHLSLPAHLRYPGWYSYTGNVLCAKDGCDDHSIDCRHGGPFLVVLAGTRFDHQEDKDVQTWAAMYSSETGVWSAPTTTPKDRAIQRIDDTRPGLVIGDALYYATIYGEYSILKYDLRKHELSVMEMPPLEFNNCILIKGNDGRLGVAAMFGSCIHMWSWQGVGAGGWVQYRVVELEDTMPMLCTGELICMAEGTQTAFIIGVESAGVFTLDLRSRQVSKIGETGIDHWSILPYMSIYTPKYISL